MKFILVLIFNKKFIIIISCMYIYSIIIKIASFIIFILSFFIVQILLYFSDIERNFSQYLSTFFLMKLLMRINESNVMKLKNFGTLNRFPTAKITLIYPTNQ
jgi:hypothetical protein